MLVIKNFFQKTKNQPMDIWFFFLFLLFFTTSLRKVTWHFPLKGTFNEYVGIFIYISDVFLFSAILYVILISLYNNFTLSSNLLSGKLWINRVKQQLIHKKWWISLSSLLIGWSFISIFWSTNQSIALFRSIKLLEYLLLYLYIIYRFVPYMFHTVKNKDVPRGTSLPTECSTWNIFIGIILFAAITNSIIAIFQFIIQHSLGLQLLRESIISTDMPGVAKIILNNNPYIRAYGLFPHPNILGGFLLFSIILTISHIKHSTFIPLSKNVPRETFFNISVWSAITNFFSKKWLLPLLLVLQATALVLTFSKSAITGLLLALTYIYVPRGTFGLKNPLKIFHAYPKAAKQLCEMKNRKITLISLILITSFYLFSPNFHTFIIQPFQERYVYLNVSRGTFLDNPVFGVGMGQFVLNMPKYSPIVLESWQFQPVHNVFLLIWMELGIIGLALFTIFIFKLFQIKQLEIENTLDDPTGNYKNNKIILYNKYYILSSTTYLLYFKAILLGFAFIMLFDHYLWDIQQGSIMLWMILGIIAGTEKK